MEMETVTNAAKGITDYGLFDKKDLLADCVGAVTGATLGI